MTDESVVSLPVRSRESFRSRLVFVDPEDDSVSYWWPAIVCHISISYSYYILFMCRSFQKLNLKLLERPWIAISKSFPLTSVSSATLKTPPCTLYYFCIVLNGCYSSVVPSTAMVPFAPDKEPFLSYARNIRRFTGDLGISRALRFWSEQEIPEGFKWLRLLEYGVVEPIPALIDPLTAPPIMSSPSRRTTSATLEDNNATLSRINAPSKKVKSIHAAPSKKGVESTTSIANNNNTSLRASSKSSLTPSTSSSTTTSNNSIDVMAVHLPILKAPKSFKIIGHLYPPSIINTRI